MNGQDVLAVDSETSVGVVDTPRDQPTTARPTSATVKCAGGGLHYARLEAVLACS